MLKLLKIQLKKRDGSIYQRILTNFHSLKCKTYELVEPVENNF